MAALISFISREEKPAREMHFMFLNWFDVLHNIPDTSCSSIQCITIVKNLHLSTEVESDLKHYESTQ